MSFIDRLRQNNLFTPQNPNPLQPPQYPSLNIAAAFRPNRIQDIASSSGPMYAPAQQPDFGPRTDRSIPRTSETAYDYGLNLDYKPTGIPETFASNILNPPERGLKFQEMFNKNAIANRGLDIKEGDQGIKQQRADTSQYSAETRRNLANLHDLTDSEKLQMLQDGRVTLQDLKDAAEMKQIQERGKNTVTAIQERGKNATELERTRQGNRLDLKNAPGPEKEMTPQQMKTDAFNKAAQIKNTDPELGKWITVDPSTGSFTIDPKTPLDSLSLIRAGIYGRNKDVKLPADNKFSNKSLEKPNDTDMVEMFTPDGRDTRMVPKDKVNLAISQGYKAKK